MLLVLWDIDGTLVDSAGHGRFAFEEAFEEVVGREPEWVEYAGRTDHQIALSMLNGSHEHVPAVLEQPRRRTWPRAKMPSPRRGTCTRESARRSPHSTTRTA